MNETRVWDRVAHRYDTIVRVFDTSYPAIRERIRRDLEGRTHLLEIAAGTGQFTPDLAQVAETVLATDISPNMARGLRARLAEEGIENVEAAVMSAYALDAPDGSFDAIFCANALHVMEEPTQALHECRRVLRADGLLVAPTFLHGADAIRRGLSRALSVVSPFVAHLRLDLLGLAELIADARFQVIVAERLPGVFPIGYVVARPTGGAGDAALG